MKKVILLLPILLLAGCVTIPQQSQQKSHYRQEFAVISSVPGIDVVLVPVGSAWTTTISNNTDKMVKFIIDESTYVKTDGTSQRLIRGQTRTMHSDSTQPSLMIPPGAKFNDILIPENLAELVNTPWLTVPSWMRSPIPANADAKAKLYFVFEIEGIKQIWICEDRFIKLE